MKLTHIQGDFNYNIYLHGQTFSISPEGTEVDDPIAEEILLHYGDIVTKFVSETKMKPKEE
jgi:hypothetical protein